MLTVGFIEDVAGRNNIHGEAAREYLEELAWRKENDERRAVWAAAQAAIPEGFGLLILERCRHSDGEPYCWRFFAVRKGNHSLQTFNPQGKAWLEEATKYMIGENPVEYSFTDCNAEYEFRLPKGSMEFVDGQWVPRQEAKYDY